MTGSRIERKSKERDRIRRLLVPIAVTAAVCAAILSAGVVGLHALANRPKRAASSTSPAVALTARDAVPATMSKATMKVLVEVPDVRGKSLDAAGLVMEYAGFEVVSTVATGSADATGLVVVTQVPAAGTKLSRGEQVTLTVAPAGSPKTRRFVVVVDPGHQARADLAPEAIGPGSSTTKERVTSGSVGVATRRSEAEVALGVSLRIAARLRHAGITVYLTRTKNDVDMSNAERARLATRLGADLFVRVHADGVTDPRVRGVGVLYPRGNRWVAPFVDKSRQAAVLVRAAVLRSTEAEDRGLTAQSDLAGFNWASCPSILLEAGCLSNAADDKLLATSEYQDRVAEGATRGVLDYFGR